MDQSITERPAAEQAALNEAEQLLAHYPSTKALAIAMTAVEGSSTIGAWGYDEGHRTARIAFKSGAIYDYHHVDTLKASHLAVAKSKGAFVNSQLVRVHHTEMLQGKPAVDPRDIGRVPPPRGAGS